jgi:type I restriction enzyme S subunit
VNGWRQLEWGDIATLEYGRALRDYREGRGSTQVFGTNGPIGYTEAPPHSTGPGVIVGRKGAYRGIHFAPGPFAVIDTAFWLKPTVPLDLRWANYELLTHDINAMDSGSAIPSTSRDAFYRMPVLVPPIEEQRAIAATLGALDDKIESNRRATSVLAELVNSHFVQTVSASNVVHVHLGEITEVVKGRSYTSAELDDSSAALVTLKSIDRNGGYKDDGLKPYTGSYKPEQVVRPGEIVVAQTDLTQGAEVVGRGVRVPESARYDTLIASLDLAIVRPKGAMPMEYLVGLLSSESFRQHCRRHVTGTTVLHLAKDAIPTWPAPVIPTSEQLRFATTARALLGRMDALAAESLSHARLRDVLLPELLSGRLVVSPGVSG